MDVSSAIRNRHSIRKYSPAEVSEDLVREVLDAARLAPSGNNFQPWRFRVIRDAEVKQLLREREIIRDKWVYDAPVIIVCCADTQYPRFVEGWDSPNSDRALRDLAIASAYMTLRATELGLGMCYCGWIKKEEIRQVLDLSDSLIVPFVMTLGYPAEEPKPRPRLPLESILV